MNPSLLMCSPKCFAVKYSINPWMESHIGKVDLNHAQQQWRNFFNTIRQYSEVKLIDPQPQVPDLVFTANAGLPWGNKFIPSHFRHKERQPEEPYFKQWFQDNGFEIIEFPQEIHFEGMGDALFQPGRDLLWAAYGFRTSQRAHEILARELGAKVISLKLIDSRFYHLDTCFCPLLNDEVMYYPGAFDADSLKQIENNTRPDNRIILNKNDANQFACNAVLIGNNLIMNSAGSSLKSRLEQSGYQVIIQPVTEFMKSGGANKCLTIHLNSQGKVH